MAWIKRNLFFVLGSLVALALMAGGGYFLFQQITDEGAVAAKIAEQYAELKRLVELNPHPGTKDIDNIKAAKDQEAALRGYIGKIHPLFERIPPIPNSAPNRVRDADFAAELRNTVTQLHHSAEQQSVMVVSNYYFTFESQKNLMVFDPASLDPMADHLGEIKAICDILFAAKINSLDSIRREKISELNDNNPTDYLAQKTITNNLAELTPYEVTFKCFSTELALVMGNFASSSNGFIVKTINVEPVASASEDEAGNSGYSMVTPSYPTPNQYSQYQLPGRRPGSPGFPPPQVATPPPVNRGPPVFLNEKPFRVTLSIIVVKLKPVK
jgi:hypothetical protein